MDFPHVRAQLTDLPFTFLRPDSQFQNWLDALATGISAFTDGVDGISNQVQNINNAIGGWCDVWGLLVGVQRMSNEADIVYLARIIYTVNAGGGTPEGIANWINAVWNAICQVVESFPSVGYSLLFQTPLTSAQIQTIVNSLSRIRPAGVPITGVFRQSGDTILDTVNYADAGRTIGAFLGPGTTPISVTLGSTTNNTTPILPTFLLDDPTLNPA